TFKVPEHYIDEVRGSIKANLYRERYTVEDRKTLLLRITSYFNTVHDVEFFKDLLTYYKTLSSDPLRIEERGIIMNYLYIVATFNGDDYFNPFLEFINTQYNVLPLEEDFEAMAYN